jgi:dTDP-glucose pyrophosphorylase
MTKKAVILARGLGTRMRRQDDHVALSEAQTTVAGAGLKALISVGRPFLDYLLSALADVGVREICLVIGPEHDVVRDHCKSLSLKRITLDFAIQESPKGTADAVKSARQFAGDDSFLMINSDSYYPIGALRALASIDHCGLVGFSREGLLKGNIEPDRVRQFAVAKANAEGWLEAIVEKPSDEQLAKLGQDAPISMNCWRFDSRIFEACDAIGPSERGEWELPTAVMYSIHCLGARYRVVPWNEPVLDLTSRRDIASITTAMTKLEVRL